MGRRTNEKYTIEDAEPIEEVGRALKFEAPIFDSPQFVPSKLIEDESEVWKEGQDPGDLVIPLWFAEKKGRV